MPDPPAAATGAKSVAPVPFVNTHSDTAAEAFRPSTDTGMFDELGIVKPSLGWAGCPAPTR